MKRNPVLDAFRQHGGDAGEWLAASDSWWTTTAIFAGANSNDVEHARRVLGRLVTR